jgi:hypothetical protein
MLLIAEVCLTVAAWRKGWRFWALLPGGIAMLMGFLMGMAIGANGGSAQQLMPVALLLDFACIAGLIGMVVRAPQKAETVAPSSKSGPGWDAAGHPKSAA